MSKILFISPTGTFDNGAEISIYYLMKLLLSIGHEIYNVAPQAGVASQIEYYDKYKDSGIETHFIPIMKWWWEEAPSGLPGTESERNFYYRNNITEIKKLIVEKKIDMVITNTVNVFQGALAAALTDTTHIWLIHEFPHGEFGYYREKFPFIADNSDALFSVRGSLNNELNQLFSDETIGDFYPYTRVETSPLISGRKRRIVSVGRLTERKNQLELVQAFERLEDSELELVFIGGWDIDYKKEMDRYISNQGLKKVTFIGGVDNPWELVTNQDICVFPSKMETFGLVYVEALIRGVPVILSDNPGHQTAFDLFEFGEIYHVGDIDQLVHKMKSVLSDFDTKSKDAQDFKKIALDIYQVENAYDNILQFINNPTFNEKSAKAVQQLLLDNGKVMSTNRYYLRFRSVISKVYRRLLKR